MYKHIFFITASLIIFNMHSMTFDSFFSNVTPKEVIQKIIFNDKPSEEEFRKYIVQTVLSILNKNKERSTLILCDQFNDFFNCFNKWCQLNKKFYNICLSFNFSIQKDMHINRLVSKMQIPDALKKNRKLIEKTTVKIINISNPISIFHSSQACIYSKCKDEIFNCKATFGGEAVICKDRSSLLMRGEVLIKPSIFNSHNQKYFVIDFENSHLAMPLNNIIKAFNSNMYAIKQEDYIDNIHSNILTFSSLVFFDFTKTIEAFLNICKNMYIDSINNQNDIFSKIITIYSPSMNQLAKGIGFSIECKLGDKENTSLVMGNKILE